MTVLKNKIIWWLFGILCVLIGLYPGIYFLIDRTFGLLGTKTEALLLDAIWNTGFYGHIIFGGLALGTGWLQFSKKLRIKNLGLHRRIGLFYLVAALISGVCGIYIGCFATGGIISAIGFVSLGVIWLGTTISAFYQVKNGSIRKHEKLMIYSFAACFSAVTLRIWLPILTSIFDEFETAYRIVAYLSWIPNLVVAYFLNRSIDKNLPSANP